MPSKNKRGSRRGSCRRQSKAASFKPRLKYRRKSKLPAIALAAGGGATPAAAPLDLNTIEQWLVDDIAGLTVTRPVQGSSKLSDLKVPLAKLTKDINAKWFPNGGGFASIDGSTTVGNLAYAIFERMQQ